MFFANSFLFGALENMKIKQLMPQWTLIALLLFGLSTAQVSAQEGGRRNPGQGPFSGIVSFGDSLSDTGNLFALTEFFPPPPYFEGRVSNGILWVEYLAIEMGMDPADVENYAWAGATTGRDNFNDEILDDFFPGIDLPGLQDQLDIFEQDLGSKKADKRALYTVWAGANDFFVEGLNPFEGIGNTVMAVQRLHDAGARRILVVNLPDLGLTPFGLGTYPDPEPVDSAFLSLLSSMYNLQLATALDQLEDDGISVVRLDAASILQQIATADPEDSGFDNVTNPLILEAEPMGTYLFWDLVHPTTEGHEVIGGDAFGVIQDAFRHPWVTPRR
jgi:phospholipase/lecithinase/hemolysin